MMIKKPFSTGLLIVAFAIVIGIAISNLFGFAGFLISAVLVTLITFLVLYFIWAPNNCFACFPAEGYATIILSGDAFYDAIIKYKDKILKKDFSIVDSNDPDKRNHKKVPFLFFGMYFIWWWPLRKVYSKEVKWTKLGREGREDRKEILDNFLLMRYLYYVDIFDAETINKIPINIGLNIEALVVNIYKAIFITKSFPLIMSSKIEEAVRNFIRTKSYEEIIKTDLRTEIVNFIKTVIDDMEEIYGVRISNLLVISVEPADKRYDQATKESIIKKKQVEAQIVDAEGKALITGIETTGAIIGMVSAHTGKSIKELQDLLEEDPESFIEKYGESLKYAQSIFELNLAIDGNSYMKLDIPKGGSSSFNGDTLALIIAANKILNQKGNDNKDDSKRKMTKAEMDAIVYRK